MTQNEISNPYDYGYHKISIEGPRFNSVNIEHLVLEISLYENLGSPFVSGNMIILDSANLSNHVNFMGQEKIKIELYDPYEQQFVVKSFVTTGVKRAEKTSDNASSFIISFVEEHVTLSNITRFSKTYEGKIETIISDILADQLNVQVQTDTSAQAVMRYIAPYTISPLKAVNMLRRRATSANGAPFFLYSSIKRPGLRLANLETLISQPAFNNQPFIYSIVTDPEYSEYSYSVENMEDRSHKIRSLNIMDNEDVVHLFEEAGFGAQYLWLDTVKDIATELRHRSPEVLRRLPKMNGDINYDDNFTVGGKPYHEGVSKYTTEITTKCLFDNINSLKEEVVIDDHMRKAQDRSIRAMLSKAPMTVQLPGYQFFENEAIGKVINLEIPKDIPIMDEAATGEDVIDKKRSGRYLVYGTRHLFKNGQYSANLNVTKLDNKDSIKNETVNQV